MKPVIEALRERCEVWTYDVRQHRGPDESPVYVMSDVMVEVEERIDTYRPDIVLLLGDRYEIGAAALAATVARIPIAHIHGGEASFGSFDNQIRDAITKLAHVHFVAAEPMRQRLLDLGEEAHRIHVVGAPGLDNLVDLPPIYECPPPYFVVTYHPATLAKKSGIHELIKALSAFAGEYRVVWTGTNADPGAHEIEAACKIWDAELCPDMTLEAYLFAAQGAAVIIGNSSSGIIEAPSLEVPTVDIGPRQDGRLKGPSIINCMEYAENIETAINCALEYKGPYDNPYGGPGASAKIADILSTIDLEGILVKRWSS